MKLIHRTLVLVFLLSTGSNALAAGLKLPFVFSDDMVLQREMADPVWGEASAGDKIEVKFAGEDKSATADADGHWMVKLDAMPASADGRELTVTDAGQAITFKNVLVGEVWLCSGQSNMEKPIGVQPGQNPTVNWQKEIAAADHPLIRLLTVPRVKRADAIKTNWEVCSPATIAKERFSAVAYFFGRKIQQDVNVPVGLIHSSWGGTRIEPWTNPQGFDLVPSLHAFSLHTTTRPAAGASALYNAMIKPMVPFAIRGALWYQGEANVVAHDRGVYFDKMQALISGWRSVWGEGDFPFYYVQLAPYTYSARKTEAHLTQELPEIWDAQRRALSIPHTGMVVITDLVDDVGNIHPVKKVEVGERLALWALANDYGKKDLVFSGPLFQSVGFSSGEATVHFDHAEGLKTSDGKPPIDFEIAGSDGKFVPADAKIHGDSVVVSALEVHHPTAVRFGWTETAMPNLVNGAGLPASPFKSAP